MLDRVLVSAGLALIAGVIAWPVAAAALWLNQFVSWTVMLPVIFLAFVVLLLYDWWTERRQQ